MVSGIYKITNTVNGHIYIGSAIDLRGRKRSHFSILSMSKHHSRYLQSAYNKYGKDAFTFTIMEYCEKHLLIEREQYYIDTLRPQYNICRNAGNSLGVKHTPEARRNMSAAQMGNKNGLGYKQTNQTCMNLSLSHLGKKLTTQHRLNVSNALKGHLVTQETRKKISDAKIGHNVTKETRKKISIALTGRPGIKHSTTDSAREKMSAAKKGKKLSAEYRAKISAGVKEMWARKKNVQIDKENPGCDILI